VSSFLTAHQHIKGHSVISVPETCQSMSMQYNSLFVDMDATGHTGCRLLLDAEFDTGCFA